MGIKTLNLLPWCFHLLTNRISCVHLKTSHDDHPIRIIKLIKPDGRVKIYDQPVTVSELIQEFPKHLVCHSDSFYIGQKILPLSETEKLKLGHNYFLLPQPFFQSVLTFVHVASFASSSVKATTQLPPSKDSFLNKAAACRQPFVIRKTPSGSLQIRVSDEFISSLIQEGKIKDGEEEDQNEEARGKICSTAQLQKDYTQLVVMSRQWKPKLETIKESRRKRFGIKRKKKSQSKRVEKEKKTQKSEHIHAHVHVMKTKDKVKGKLEHHHVKIKDKVKGTKEGL